MPYLDVYSGDWSANQARHLLRRTSFGITQTLVEEAVSLGLTGTISRLFTEDALPDPPVKFAPDGTETGEVNDPEVNYGETWIHAAPYPIVATTQERNRILRARTESLYAWSFLQMQNSGISIREKLTLFWHNHFVSENTHAHREYTYINLLRENAFGNFKELVKKVTIDVNMLLYLSGSQNTRNAPNENYSRELLELFTIGKGNAVGNGDYTNYTEDDVTEMAKILTGWRVNGIQTATPLVSFFNINKHTLGDKNLSHRFNNAVITENGENEYKDLIDVIFEQEECSRFITRKLYRWFVDATITEDIETNIIEPLALIIRNNNYNLTEALETLLSSEHFFEATFCMIKSPVDLMFSATKSLFVSAPTTTIEEEYDFGAVLYIICNELEQGLYHHPNVAGWKAYYQEPLFYKTWINNFLLPKRLEYCKKIVTGGDLTIDGNDYNIPPLVPVLAIVVAIANAQDPNILISELANQLFNRTISDAQITSLKDVLIPGLPDFEWTVEYVEFLADPTDDAKRISVDNKLRSLIAVMVQMSEFQIM
jgi:uncharacterized protein (DUF1800 family)